MDREYRFLNPYNFVRYLDKGEDNGSPEAKLLGRCAPPPHDRFLGLTGRIECELEAKTPIFISDSEFVEDKGNEHRSYRFFRLKNKNGEEDFAIPSTSLRGMLRSVFEAATNSCFSVFEGEKRLSYHLPAKESKKLVPGRIEKDEDGNWYLRPLPGTTHYKQNGPDRKECLYAAWIKMYSPLNSSQTEKQNPASPYTNRRIIDLPKELKHGDKCYALLEKIEHPSRKNSQGKSFGRFYFWNVKKITKNKDELPGSEELEENERIEEGYLCVTFQNMLNKHDERFFFRAEENNSLPEKIPLDNDILQKYKSLILDYKERHKKDIERKKRKNIDLSKPYNIDNKKTVPAYSRFILEDKEDLDGELVYAMLEGEPGNLTVKFFVPASVPRVWYENTIGDLLPEHLHPCSDYNNLCPACRVFGWVHPDSSNKDLNVKVAYAGRVKISHALMVENKGTLEECPLAILSTPKPTTTFFYLLKHRRPDFGVTYDTYGATLRGRKFYRHQDDANEQEYVRAGKIEGDQNRTVRDALKPGARFKFTMEFENLALVELGALLWSIEMEDGMFHKLGMGKPLGFGSVKISIKKLEVLNIKERYSSFKSSGWRVVNKDTYTTKWTNLFKKAMKNRYGKDFDDLENIKDLKAILSSSRLPVHYPRTTEKPTREGRNFEWFMQNKKQGKMPLKLAEEDTEGFPLKFKHEKERKKKH